MVSDLIIEAILAIIFRRKKEVIVIKATPITLTQLIKHKECPICFEGFAYTDKVILLKCSHLFCKSCFTRWTKTSIYCPYCRQECEQ